MQVKKRGTIMSRLIAVAAVVAVVLGMSLSIATATDEGVQETPIVATATTEAREEVSPVVKVLDSEDEGDKPESVPSESTADVEVQGKGNKPTPKPTKTSTPTQEPTPTKPDPVSGEVPSSSLACLPEGGGTVTTTVTPWTQDWVLESGKWVLGEKIYGEPVDNSREATAEECPAPDPEPTPTETVDPTDPPMEEFVTVVMEACQVTITQKLGVDWTEILTENGDPAHWGIGVGNETVTIRPVDPTKPVVIRIITVIAADEAWEYFVTFEPSSSCDDPDPTPTPPTPTTTPTQESTSTPEPSSSVTPTATSTPTMTPTASSTSEPTTAPTPTQESTSTPEPSSSVTPTATSTPTMTPTASSTSEPTKDDQVVGLPSAGVADDGPSWALLGGLGLALALSFLVAATAATTPKRKEN